MTFHNIARMIHHRSWTGLLLLVMPSMATGQLTISDPLEPSRRPSLEVSTNTLPAVSLSVQTVCLWVDDEMRQWIHDQIPPSSFNRQTTKPASIAPTNLSTFRGEIQSRLSLHTATHVSKAILSRALADTLIQRVQQSPVDEVKRSPDVNLVEGKEAEIRDMIQRPFPIGATSSESKSGSGKSEKLEEGTRLRFLAYRPVLALSPHQQKTPNQNSIQLVVEILLSKITSIQQPNCHAPWLILSPLEFPISKFDQRWFPLGCLRNNVC